MSAVSAHALIATHDCAQPGCVSEAGPRSNFCRPHQTKETNRMTVMCKIDGCTNEAVQQFGKLARLCTTHRSDAAPADSGGASVPPSGDSLAAKARAIVPLAAKLDRTAAKLAQLPERARAKAAFDEASRRASVDASPENLARVQSTLDALTKDQPKRIKIESEYSEAERALGLAMQDLVRSARGAA